MATNKKLTIKNLQLKTFRILGVDPGYERVGIAVVEKKKKEKLLFSECFKTSAKFPHSKRLLLIGKEINSVINKFKPTALSIETLFFNENQKTAMKVSEARGTILYAAEENNLDIFEYTPLQIKMAITGNGRADKRSMIKMLALLIKLPNKVAQDDEYDAIAAALTHAAIQRGNF